MFVYTPTDILMGVIVIGIVAAYLAWRDPS